ncbi:MAG: hypothetical protein ACXWCB_08740 [Acidimicrobiales bacterium]
MPDVRSDTIHAHGLLCSASPRSPIGWLELGPGLLVPIESAHESSRGFLQAFLHQQLQSVGLAAVGHSEVGQRPFGVVAVGLHPIGLLTLVLPVDIAVDDAIGCASIVTPPVGGPHAGR